MSERTWQDGQIDLFDGRFDKEGWDDPLIHPRGVPFAEYKWPNPVGSLLGPPLAQRAPAKRSPHQDVLLNLPDDAASRKAAPVATGVLDYFPAAMVAVAQLSKAGNDQHNPGEPLHWARAKSTDQADCIVRHLMQRGTLDSDGVRHSAKVAWRALALLQEEIERDAGFVPAGEG